MSAAAWLGVMLVVGAALVAWWSLSGVRVEAGAIRRNLGPSSGSLDLRTMDLARSANERVMQPLTGAFARRARRLTPQGWSEGIDHRIKLAGMQDNWPVDRMLAVKLVLAIVGALLGAVVFVSSPSLGTLLWAVLLGGMGWMIPETILSRRARERQAEIERSLPDVIDQVTIAVEAGLGFEAALARAARTSHGPLAEELARTMSEIRAGVPRDAAFDNMLERTEARDLRHFVMATQQAHRHGIPIAKVLRVQSNELRDKRRQRAEEAAQKVPLKVIFPLIFCILPALFIVVLGPAVIRIGQTFK
jgi:tight adherence protein C